MQLIDDFGEGSHKVIANLELTWLPPEWSWWRPGKPRSALSLNADWSYRRWPDRAMARAEIELRKRTHDVAGDSCIAISLLQARQDRQGRRPSLTVGRMSGRSYVRRVSKRIGKQSKLVVRI